MRGSREEVDVAEWKSGKAVGHDGVPVENWKGLREAAVKNLTV